MFVLLARIGPLLRWRCAATAATRLEALTLAAAIRATLPYGAVVRAEGPTEPWPE